MDIPLTCIHVPTGRPYITPTLTPSRPDYTRKVDIDEDEDDVSSGRQSPMASGRSGGEEKKPKKVKNGKQPEYLCRNCGRNDSPEWRKVSGVARV